MRHNGWLRHQQSSSPNSSALIQIRHVRIMLRPPPGKAIHSPILIRYVPNVAEAALDCLYRLFHLMTISMKGDGLNNNSPNVESFIELCLYDCAHTLQKYYANTTWEVDETPIFRWKRTGWSIANPSSGRICWQAYISTIHASNFIILNQMIKWWSIINCRRIGFITYQHVVTLCL